MSMITSTLHPSYWKPGDIIRYDGGSKNAMSRVGIDVNEQYTVIDMVDIYNNRETYDVVIMDRFGEEHYRAEDFTFVKSIEDIREEKINQIIE